MMIQRCLVPITLGALVLLPAPSHALLLCAAIDSASGGPKEGAVVRLRAACKVKKDGSPAEVALGTTEDLARIGGFQALATGLAGVEQETARTDSLARAQLASLDGHLGQFYAVDATGSSQSANATTTKTAYEDLLELVTDEASMIAGFNQAPPASPNGPWTQDAKDKCNAWVQKTIDVTDQMKTDLQTAIALADLSITVFGNIISFGNMLDTAAIAALEKARDHMKGQEYQDCSGAMKQLVSELRDDASNLPGQYGDEAEESKGQIEDDLEYAEDLDELIRWVLDRLRAIVGATEETQRGLLRL